MADSIRGLYAAFGSVQKPASIEACPCCEKHKEVCALLDGPLNRVPTLPLSKYAFSAFYTVGSEADFKYLLPRILELATSDVEWYTDLEVLLPKLRLAHWETWSKQQLDAVNAFLTAGFEGAVLSIDEPGRAVDSWLCGLALAHIDLEPFQRRLLQPNAAQALRELYEWNSHKLLMKGKLANTFWAGNPQEAQVVATWLKSPDVQCRVLQH